MAKILSLSSHVVYGHVGNAVSVFVWQRLGHNVLNCPTIILSNRPGYAATSGTATPLASLEAMLDALNLNGQLDDLDAIVTGYLPSLDHVALCAKWIIALKIKQSRLRYLCDPILGDRPFGVYIDEQAATAIRNRLLPLADIITPNIFELEWLSGHAIGTQEDAVLAAQKLLCSTILITSAPSTQSNMLSNILIHSASLSQTSVKKRHITAHGTGDFFASYYLGALLSGFDNVSSLKAATYAMDQVLEQTGSHMELALIETQNMWANIVSDPTLSI